VTERSKLMK